MPRSPAGVYGPRHTSLLRAREGPSPSFPTWNVCYEVLRAAIHPRVFDSFRTPGEGWSFPRSLLDSLGFDLLAATRRHAVVLAQTPNELKDMGGNLFHDLLTAVLMRDHGISRICTHDKDFHRFPLLTVVTPLR